MPAHTDMVFMIYLIFLSIMTSITFAHTPLQGHLLDLEFKDKLKNGSCYERYQSLKKIWAQTAETKNQKLILEGSMGEAFTREEIISMKNVNQHGLQGKVRGTEKFIRGGYSFAHTPSFPHTTPGCEKVYQEEVKVIDVHGMKCREIKFTQDHYPDAVYYQVYCQDSKDLLISFDPKNEFSPEELLPKDKICVHCQK